VKKYKDKQFLQVEGQLDNVNQTLANVLGLTMQTVHKQHQSFLGSIRGDLDASMAQFVTPSCC
jgi:hypothetical protein